MCVIVYPLYLRLPRYSPSLPRYFRQLNPDREVPPLLIDTDAFSSALSAGDLDVCVQLLRSCNGGDPAAAVLNCRAAEALFHGGRRDEALECGRHQDATAAYEQLLAWSPDWAEGHRHLSGSLAAIGDFTGAAAHARRAV